MNDARERAEALEACAGVRALPDLGVLTVEGEDALVWLNGQITNDIKDIPTSGSVYALVIDVRGKILADVWVMERGEGLLALLPKARIPALLEHFDKYIIMEDVELEEPPLAVLTAQGPRAAEVIAAAELEHRSTRVDRLGLGGFDLLVPADDADAALARLSAAAVSLGGTTLSESDWELAHLRHDRPRFGVDFDEARYPQEAGLKDRAVSFEKGCYLGQEVVCMLENRGQLVRHLVRLETEGPIPSGSALLRDGEAVGATTSSALDPVSGRAITLAYVKRAHAEPGVELDASGQKAVLIAKVGESLAG